MNKWYMFLGLAQNIDCGLLLELPSECGSFYIVPTRLFIPCSNVCDIVNALIFFYMKPISLQ